MKIIELQEDQNEDGEFLTQDEIWDKIERDPEYYKDKIKLSPEDIAISIQDNGLKQTIRELNGESDD